MENASKALIIAGVALVAILIITVAVIIVNAGYNEVSEVNLSEYEIQLFNEKFTIYCGKNVSSKEANDLIKTAFYHNLAQETASTRVRVGFNGGGNGNGTIKSDTEYWLVMREQFYEDTKLKTVPAGNRYRIEAKMDNKTGLIYEIQIWTR